MKCVKHPGVCKLCGKYTELTEEHVPPKRAFNSSSIMVYSFEEYQKKIAGEDDKMPWDFSGLKGKIRQGGNRGFWLCKDCNSNTGSWYVSEYVDLVHCLSHLIQNEALKIGNAYNININNVHPLRIFKAIMTMFCDINNNCFDDESLRQFLMEKENQAFNEGKYSLYCFLTTTHSCRIRGISGIATISGGATLVSEIITYPFGLALYINKPSSFQAKGYCMNTFSHYSYDEMTNITFEKIPYLEVNSQFPTDFRSKEEIEQDYRYNLSLQNELLQSE